MTTAESVEQRRANRMLAVDEAYRTLGEYTINRRRVVFIANDERRAGGYGIVRKAHLRASSYLPPCLASLRYGRLQVVAVKEIRLSLMYDSSDLKRAVTKEILVWSRLKGHPGISQFLGFHADFGRKEVWLISPWEPYGNVSQFTNARQLEVPEKLSLLYDTIDALVFLHQLEPPVCHGDIKSANVLVNLDCRAVLSDFGLARLHEDSGFSQLETTTMFKGSIRWCSPELLDGGVRTPSSDIYAWAWLVWEIMIGELPYADVRADYLVVHKIFQSPSPQVHGESRLGECLQLWDLMTRCWAAEPRQRPSSAVCKTTLEYLPHCPPTPKSADSQARSAALLESLGEVESWKGNHKAGFVYLEEALHLYQEEGNDRGVASVLRKQAVVAVRDSNHAKAMDAASAALEKCRALRDDNGVADSLYKLGCSFLMENNRVDALRNLQEGSKIFRAKENTVYLAKCLSALGELYRRENLAEKASSALEEAVEIASRCGDRLGEASALMILGATYRGRDHTDQAIYTLQRAEGIARNIGWEHGLSTCLCRLGAIKLQQGIHLEAEKLLSESVRVARSSDAGFRLGQALGQSGRCFRAQGRHEEAVSALEESYSVYQKIALDFEPDLAGAATLLADSKSALGDKEGALAWSDRAVAEWRKGGNQVEISRCLALKGAHLVDMDRCDEAALHFEASLVIDQALQDESGVRWNRRKLSSLPKTVIGK